MLFPVAKVTLSLTDVVTQALISERLDVTFLNSNYMTGDSFTKSPVFAPSVANSLENGDRNSSQAFDPLTIATRLGRKIFKTVRFALS